MLKTLVGRMADRRPESEFEPGRFIDDIPASCRGIGESPAWTRVLDQVRCVAGSNATVLITGETGTGKELVARAIHHCSGRRHRRMVAVNCGGLPESLFESEFFGSVKGAFTGSLRDKPGRFELADGGTLFLDEIGEVPLAMQSKLLRALQEQEIERVGDVAVRSVDVRIVAATNRDLAVETAGGRFREDLYYRLNVFPIRLPSLRDRKEDIPLLAEYFLGSAAGRLGTRPHRLEAGVAEDLSAYPWPGNIRELQNVIERAVIVSGNGPLTLSLPSVPAVPADEPVMLTRPELKRRERESILAALGRTEGKIFGPRGAAALLGMKPTTLYSRIHALDLREFGALVRCENPPSGL